MMHVFADDIILVDEICDAINAKFEPWQEKLEVKVNGFRFSKGKTEYIDIKFNSSKSSKIIVEIRDDKLICN